MEKQNKKDFPELREDPVSGDWILVAPARRKRLDHLNRTGPYCPFEDPQASGHDFPSVVFPENSGERWQIQIIPNKFPAVTSDGDAKKVSYGPYSCAAAIGYHDIVITRDHDKNLAAISTKSLADVLRTIQKRYKDIAKDPRIAYVSVFHNWGERAGASIRHPHCQMIAISVVPPDIFHSLAGSTRHFKKTGSCVHCEIIRFEMEAAERIIFANNGAVVFAPFASREPFEIRIFPTRHSSYFEDAEESEILCVAEALRSALRLLEKRFPGINYNFFIHTAPVKDKAKCGHYHWHIEIIPKISISAGFELGTGIEITSVSPEESVSSIRETSLAETRRICCEFAPEESAAFLKSGRKPRI